MRKSGTILGWLSDIGGFNDALCLITKPFFAYVSAFSYSLSVTNGMPTTVQKTSQDQNSQAFEKVAAYQRNKLYNRIRESTTHKLGKSDLITLLNPIRQLGQMKVTFFNQLIRLRTNRDQELIQQLRER